MPKSLTHYARFLDTVGDQSGSIDMAVDGSTTPVLFKFTVPAGKIAYITRIVVSIVANSKSDSGGFGDLSALTNGMTFYILGSQGTIIEDLSFQLPIKKTTDLQAYCHDLLRSSFGTGAEQVTARYTFEKDGAPLVLNEGQSYAWRVNDDITGLVDMYIRAGVALYTKYLE
jgi:hypothetical protein